MANWSKLQEDLVGLPVAKRAKHGIHFKNNDGSITANFSGKPCHFQENGIWKPIDTALLATADGWFSSPHSDVIIHPDGRVRVKDSTYQQFTKLPAPKAGRLAGDRVIREFPGGEQHLIMTENGFKEEIHVFKPKFPIEKFIAKTYGTLPTKYTAHPITAVDANEDAYTFTGDVAGFGTWLAKATYPVVIDPDFTSTGTDYRIYGQNADYATARSTSSAIASTTVAIGQRVPSYYNVYRGYVKFDTSSIGSGSTVTQVNLKLTVAVDISDADVDIQIAKYNWSAFAASQVAGERETAYDGALAADLDDSIWRNTSGISENTGYTSGNLATAWVSKTGTTYYALRSKEDTDNSAPAGNEYITVYGGQEVTEAYRPVLTVTYTAAGTFIPINMNAQMQALTGNMRG